MTVRNELARGVARVREAEPVDHVVESRLEKLEQCFAGHAALAQGVLENSTELALEQTVLITKLLFLAESNRVFGLFPPRTFRTVHSRRIIFPLERFRRSKNLHTVAAADPCLWSGISSHMMSILDAALFRRTATVVRNRRNVADQSEIESDRLERAHRGLASRAGTFDEDLDFFESVTHRLS